MGQGDNLTPHLQNQIFLMSSDAFDNCLLYQSQQDRGPAGKSSILSSETIYPLTLHLEKELYKYVIKD